MIEDEDDLFLQTPTAPVRPVPARRKGRHRGHRDRPGRPTRSRCGTAGGEESAMPYDVLVLSPGAAPVRPPLPWLRPGARRCARSRTPSGWPRTSASAPRTAVVIGGGFVGLETAENLAQRGIADHRRRDGRAGADPARPGAGGARGGRARRQWGPGRHGGTGDRGHDRRCGPGRRPLPPSRPGDRPPSAFGPTCGWRRWRDSNSAREEASRSTLRPRRAPRTSTPWAMRSRSRTRSGGEPSLIALANVANRQGRRVADAICGLPVRPTVRSGRRSSGSSA